MASDGSSKKEEVPQANSIVRVGVLPFSGAGEFGRVKLATHHQKETWLHFVYFLT